MYKYHLRIGSESKAKKMLIIKISHIDSTIDLNQRIVTPLLGFIADHLLRFSPLVSLAPSQLNQTVPSFSVVCFLR